ncbi:MAG: adenylate cyclase [Arenicella sp.]|jgi:adenylate cyclase
MPVEIEHKYLINFEKWEGIKPDSSIPISQAYMKTDGEKTIRIRTTDTIAYLTIKGKTVGATRSEFEYEIPLEEGQQLMTQFCENKVEKVRHLVAIGSHTWEVDQFIGENEGLWVAEIELESESEEYDLPEWITQNVTLEGKYTNAALAKNPYSKW